MVYVSYLNRSFPPPLSLLLNAAISFSVILNLNFIFLVCLLKQVHTEFESETLTKLSFPLFKKLSILFYYVVKMLDFMILWPGDFNNKSLPTYFINWNAHPETENFRLTFKSIFNPIFLKTGLHNSLNDETFYTLLLVKIKRHIVKC